MRYFALFVFFCFSKSLCAQPFPCLDEFKFVKNHIKRNHGGFNKKIKSVDNPVCKQFMTGLERQISALKDEQYCLAYLKKYVLYLKDYRSNILPARSRQIDENSRTELDSFFQTPYTGLLNISISMH